MHAIVYVAIIYGLKVLAIKSNAENEDSSCEKFLRWRANTQDLNFLILARNDALGLQFFGKLTINYERKS